MDINLLTNCIKSLIVDNDNINIPGLGMFVAVMIPASYSNNRTTINPPYRKLSFTKCELSNEQCHEFVEQVAQYNGCASEDATNYIRDCVGQIVDDLKSGKSVHFQGLGTLTPTPSDGIAFTEEDGLEIDPYFVGFEPIHLKEKNNTQEINTNDMAILGKANNLFKSYKEFQGSSKEEVMGFNVNDLSFDEDEIDNNDNATKWRKSKRTRDTDDSNAGFKPNNSTQGAVVKDTTRTNDEWADDYDSALSRRNRKEEEQIEKREERRRIEAEKIAEKERIEAEKREERRRLEAEKIAEKERKEAEKREKQRQLVEEKRKKKEERNKNSWKKNYSIEDDDFDFLSDDVDFGVKHKANSGAQKAAVNVAENVAENVAATVTATAATNAVDNATVNNAENIAASIAANVAENVAGNVAKNVSENGAANVVVNVAVNVAENAAANVAENAVANVAENTAANVAENAAANNADNATENGASATVNIVDNGSAATTEKAAENTAAKVVVNVEDNTAKNGADNETYSNYSATPKSNRNQRYFDSFDSDSDSSFLSGSTKGSIIVKLIILIAAILILFILFVVIIYNFREQLSPFSDNFIAWFDKFTDSILYTKEELKLLGR